MLTNHKMICACVGLAALTADRASADVTAYESTLECSVGWVPLVRTTFGVTNNSSVDTQVVVCPIVRRAIPDPMTLRSIRVYYRDRNTVQNVNCTLYGSTIIGPTVTSCDSLSGCTTDAGETSYLDMAFDEYMTQNTYNLVCYLPPYREGPSRLMGYQPTFEY